MKKQIKEIALNSTINYYGFLRKLQHSLDESRKEKPSVMLLPPTDSGSLGDQAMVHGTMQCLKMKGIDKFTLVAYDSVSDCQNFYSHEAVFKYQSKLDFVQAACKHDIFFCLGADVMDGFYSEKRSILRTELVSMASRLGLKSRVLGFSFNPNPSDKAVCALSNLPSNVDLCARDPVSCERLHKHLKRPITLVADLAFLLEPANSGSSSSLTETHEWLCSEKHNGHILIGINANSKLLDNPKLKTVEELCRIYAEALKSVFHENNQKVSFVFISHDFREKENRPSDFTFADKIITYLPPQIRLHCLRISPPYSAGDVKSICGKLDVVLTGRMHLAIESLGQGTPPACITYQGKFEGLFQHFDLSGMTIEPEKLTSSNQLTQFLLPIIYRRNEIRTHINSQLQEVKRLAKLNLEV
ncbi:MAG: polysaccharide pyruvyl transferase family protein [Elainellaceae cyanobacterium]